MGSVGYARSHKSERYNPSNWWMAIWPDNVSLWSGCEPRLSWYIKGQLANLMYVARDEPINLVEIHVIRHHLKFEPLCSGPKDVGGEFE